MEPCFSTIQEIASDALRQIKRDLERTDEYCLLGYSMGALVCYELYYMLKNTVGRLPKHMFLIASGPPHWDRKMKDYKDAEKQEIIDYIKQLNGTDSELLECDEMLDYLLPIARNDFSAIYHYVPTVSDEKITCPACVYYGKNDNEIQNCVLEWSRYFEKKVKFVCFSGDYFFMFRSQSSLRSVAMEIITAMKADIVL